MSPPTLAQRVLAIESSLSDVPHAFGGALALAYYAEPRATIDIDLNVFVPTDRFAEVAAPLVRLGAPADDPDIEAIVRRDGQVRVMWDATPIDLFFSYDPFHDAAGAARHSVPFGDGTIPILAADHLVVCKTIFNRPKDWVDIDAMLAAEADIDPAEVLRWVARIAGDDDPRYNRVAALLTRRIAGW
ncbi:MAG: nucleotidyl transferase AbiEii/AbiGii toxin family protein [Acidimicrobiales bacterium]